MDLSPKDIRNIANQDYILGNTSVDEQIEFIEDQITDPFDSGSANYFKRLRKLLKGDAMHSACIDLLSNVEDRYPELKFDLSGYDQSAEYVFDPVYKFFVKNIHTFTYRFLREYIYSSKNRKALVADYLTTKIPTYPKEQYGKKEFYILLTKLSSIVKDIMKDDDIRLSDFIDYIERGGDTPMCVVRVKEYLDDGIICDYGVMGNIFQLFKKSDSFDSILCKLQMDITKNIIDPYLQDNGLISLKLPPVEPQEEDDPDDEDDQDEVEARENQ